MNFRDRFKSNIKMYWSYYCFLTVIAIVLLIRARFSFQQSDESFYLALADRLWKGEKLILDEWHPAQFYSPLVLVPYGIYRFFVPDGAGIILFFRILMIVFAYCISVVLFNVIVMKSKLNGLYTTICIMPVLLFAKSNNFGASYTTICFYFFVLGICLYFISDNNKNISHKIIQIAGGICFAMAVICMPYFAIAVGLYCMISLLVKKKDQYLFGGVILSAVVYIVFFLDIFNIDRLIEGMKYIFQDPEHSDGFIIQLKDSIEAYIKYIGLFGWIFVICSIIIIGYGFYKKKKWIDQVFRYWFLLSLVVILILSVLKGSKNLGYVYVLFDTFMCPVIIWGYHSKKKMQTSIFFMVAGVFLNIAFGGGSNTTLNGMTIGFAVIAIGMMMISLMYLDKEKKVLKNIEVALMVLLTLILLGQRVLIVCRDDSLVHLNAKIEQGPAKGIYTNTEHKSQYESVITLLDKLENDYPDSKVFYTKLLPWAYVYTDFEYASPTSWRTALDSERLKEWYDVHPDKLPDLIVQLRPEIGSYEEDAITGKSGNSRPNENVETGYMVDYINNMDFDIIDVDVAIVYRIKTN